MIIIDESEVKSLKLNINEYLTLLVINGTLNDFVYTSENLNKLLELGFLIKLPNQEIILIIFNHLNYLINFIYYFHILYLVD